MLYRTNFIEIPHTERRNRGLNAEIDRLFWEYVCKKTLDLAKQKTCSDVPRKQNRHS